MACATSGCLSRGGRFVLRVRWLLRVEIAKLFCSKKRVAPQGNEIVPARLIALVLVHNVCLCGGFAQARGHVATSSAGVLSPQVVLNQPRVEKTFQSGRQVFSSVPPDTHKHAGYTSIPALTFEGTSGIRGPLEEVETAAPYLAAALVEVSRKEAGTKRIQIFLGFDTRENSQRIAETVRDRLLSSGVEVVFVEDPVASPVFAALIALKKNPDYYVRGVMITGSHNPSTDNGFAVRAENGAILIDGMRDIYTAFCSLWQVRRLPEPSQDIQPSVRVIGASVIRSFYWENSIENNPLFKKIVKHLQQRGILSESRMLVNPAEVLYDPMQGVGTFFVPYFLEALGFKVRVLDGEGSVIEDYQRYQPRIQRSDRKPYPNRSRVSDWQTVMKSAGLDIVLANDGDGDRIGVAQDYGFLDWNELFVALIYYLGELEIIRSLGYTHIVSTYTTTDALQRLAQRYGLTLINVPVGFKYISRMVEDIQRQGGKVLGGFEGNGGLVFCQERSGIDKDGILANIFLALLYIDCREQGKTLRGLAQDAYRSIGLDANFGYMTELAIPYNEQTQEYFQRVSAAVEGGVFLGQDIDRAKTVIINPDKPPDRQQWKIVFPDASWIILRPSGTESTRARIYAEAGDKKTRAALLFRVFQDFFAQSEPAQRRSALAELDMLLSAHYPFSRVFILDAVTRGDWKEALEWVGSYAADDLGNVCSRVEAALLNRQFDTAGDMIAVLGRHSAEVMESVVAAVDETLPSRYRAVLDEIVSTVRLAGFYGISLGGRRYSALQRELALCIYTDIFEPAASRENRTCALLRNPGSGAEVKKLLYQVLAPPAHLIFSDPHATYRSVGRLLASVPTARPVVIGDITYRGQDLFNLMRLLEQTETELLYGEKEFWYLGACLGIPFLTALSVQSELRYGNEHIFGDLGVDLQPLKDFSQRSYEDSERAKKKEYLPKSFNSIEEQAMFNLRLKHDPLLAEMDKALILGRIPGGDFGVDERRFTPAQRAVVDKIRANPDLTAADLDALEKQELIVLTRGGQYAVSAAEREIMRKLSDDFITSEKARELALYLLRKFKLFTIIRPPLIVEELDRSLSRQLGPQWQKSMSAILIHGNIVTDAEGRFVDLDGMPLGAKKVLAYYREIEVQVREFTQFVEALYARLETGRITPGQFAQEVNGHSGALLIQKLALSPYSPLFARFEKGAEYLYWRDVEERNNYSYDRQTSSSARLFMDEVFRQFHVDPQAGVLVLGHLAQKSGRIFVAAADDRVMIIDPYFVKKGGGVGETGNGAALVVGRGMFEVVLRSDVDAARVFAPAEKAREFREGTVTGVNVFSARETDDWVYPRWEEQILRERAGPLIPESGIVRIMQALWLDKSVGAALEKKSPRPEEYFSIAGSI
ncbi:MAG: fructose-bisphosphatase class III [Candidatus Omnitrophica bacterium]|nr:fructose-bisphosphatase class III [Candidatus Omnitrophota bacterium]